MTACSPPATADARATGTTERARYSGGGGAGAGSTDAIGVPKIAVMPAAAPAASNVLRSFAVTRMTWPSQEPIAPPVAMIGPSAPNGPPVPLAIAEEIGLRFVIRRGIF